MKKIIVSVTNDLTNDQRVARVCTSLTNMNYTVLLVGRKLPESTKLQRNYKTKRFKLFFNNGFLFYAEFNIRLFFFLLFTKKDLLLSNDLDTLLPNFLISKIQGKKLIYDSHELFPEIPELVNRPFVKKIWEGLEKFLLPKIKNNYTVSTEIANFYHKKYGVHFHVVRNIPVKKNELPLKELPFNHQNKKIIIYQGATNVGRGLELMMDTMQLLEDTILLIIGKGDIFESLQDKIKDQQLAEKVKFLGKLPPEKLQHITPLAHIGLSLEEDLGLSYRYALPNKLFDYIQAKIPVIVSNLPEMKRIVTEYKIGDVLLERTPEKLAEKITQVLNTDYSIHLKKASEVLIWENEELTLQRIFDNLM